MQIKITVEIDTTKTKSMKYQVQLSGWQLEHEHSSECGLGMHVIFCNNVSYEIDAALALAEAEKNALDARRAWRKHFGKNAKMPKCLRPKMYDYTDMHMEVKERD